MPLPTHISVSSVLVVAHTSNLSSLHSPLLTFPLLRSPNRQGSALRGTQACPIEREREMRETIELSRDPPRASAFPTARSFFPGKPKIFLTFHVAAKGTIMPSTPL
jgi:hypothetical protein